MLNTICTPQLPNLMTNYEYLALEEVADYKNLASFTGKEQHYSTTAVQETESASDRLRLDYKNSLSSDYHALNKWCTSIFFSSF